jgi:hypothetical protein
MPGVTAGQLDIDVVLIGDVRTEDIEDVDLGSRGSRRVRVALVVWRQRALVRMGASVSVRDVFDDRVAEYDGAVAGEQVAAVQPLGDEQRVLV